MGNRSTSRRLDRDVFSLTWLRRRHEDLAGYLSFSIECDEIDRDGGNCERDLRKSRGTEPVSDTFQIH